MDYIGKYVSLVSVESPTESVSKSNLDIRFSFIDKLGIIGGNLALWVGMSVLSFAEVVILIYIVIIGTFCDLRSLFHSTLTYLGSDNAQG